MNVLIIDDEGIIRELLRKILAADGYSCDLAANTTEARDSLSEKNFDLILCDVDMPGESGIEFIRHVNGKYPNTAIVMVSGIDKYEIAETALDIGAYGYVIKPFNPNALRISVANAMIRRKLEIQARLHREELERTVAMRTAELKKTFNKLRNSVEGIIKAMSLAVEYRDPYTAGHQHRVADLSHFIGRELGLSGDQLDSIRMAGMIHDLGKISVPAEILAKPGKLNEMEFELIKNHSQVGFDILQGIEFPWPIAQMVLQHHERLDGSGYPQGLTDNEIMLESKIIGVADVVEAMASHRPYRPAMGIEKALEEITQNMDVLYPGDVVGACIKIFEGNEFNLST